jgi:thioredoxin 1
MFGPIFESVSEKMPNVKFLKFEVDAANREVPGKYGIRSIPSILIFRNGELAAARSGLQQENDFVSWIKETQGGA